MYNIYYCNYIVSYLFFLDLYCKCEIVEYLEVTRVFLKVCLLQVFSAFGFVHKIATFEKSAGFQVGH